VELLRDELIRKRARRLLAAGHLRRQELALAFGETTATHATLYVEGRNFYPAILSDIESAASSVHVIQFGFRPGRVGDRFADVLASKAASRVPIRLVVDEQGSHPYDASKEFYARLAAAGDVVVTRGTKIRAPFGVLGERDRPMRWNLGALGHIDHRKALVVDGRIAWIGGAGIEDHFEDGRFHDLFVRLEGPVASQLQLVFVASFRWLGGRIPPSDVEPLFPRDADRSSGVPAVILHNAPGRYRPITAAIAEVIDGAERTLDIVNPYVTDRRMIRRMEAAARRGVSVRLVVPANPNNWACGAAQRFHHRRLLEAGVRILEYPTMVHAKALVRDGEDVLAGTCNLEAWSLRRFFEINVRVRSSDLGREFADEFFAPAEAVCSPGTVPSGFRRRMKAAAFAAASPLL
jgi:cardiolipin synthase